MPILVSDEIGGNNFWVWFLFWKTIGFWGSDLFYIYWVIFPQGSWVFGYISDFITMIPGVLILSPFAGAGGLMHEALMANPYETNIVAEALDRALSMELDERKMRMNQLKKREKRMDVDAWVRGFMAGMSTLNPRSVPGKYIGSNAKISFG